MFFQQSFFAAIAAFSFLLYAQDASSSTDASSTNAENVDEATSEPSSKAGPGTTLPWQIKAAGGYAIRLSPDGRTNGGGALLQADVPVWGPFGIRVGGIAMGYAGSLKDPRPLAFGGGHVSLLYAVDEGEIAGRLHVGPLAGFTSEFGFGNTYPELPKRDGFYAGVVFGVDAQWQLSKATALSVGADLPVFLLDPDGFTLRAPFDTDQGGVWMFQAMIHVGLSFEPVLLVKGMLDGEGVLDLLLPHDVHLPF
ncbi:MAG: hypothetical protein GY822_22555 [Deltaproteobacteria bacterium]|nr:hypothetical protein [Deltaproteobacteria bacterium]